MTFKRTSEAKGKYNNEVLFIVIQNVKNIKHQTFFKNKNFEDSITPFL